MTNPVIGFGNNLLNSVSVDTVGEAEAAQDKIPKNLYIYAEDFGGGTVRVEWSLSTDNDAVWTTVTDPLGNPVAVNNNTMYTSLTLYGAFYRAVLSGSTGASNVSVRLV